MMPEAAPWERVRLMDWARILAYVTGMVDQELLARNEYLAAENRILRAQLKGRLQLSDAERATLGEIENSWLYSPAMACLTPLPMVETGLLSFSNCLFRAICLPLTIGAAQVFHLIRLKKSPRMEFLRPTGPAAARSSGSSMGRGSNSVVAL